VVWVGSDRWTTLPNRRSIRRRHEKIRKALGLD
jgi:hypothetical protein